MISGLTDTKRERERERARRESRESELERERERAPEESDHRASFGRRASFVHHLPSAMQALSTIWRLPCKLCPPSLFSSSLVLSLFLWPTMAESSTACHRSIAHHPPPAVATTSRSNHRSRCPKPQAQYRCWQLTAVCAPSSSPTHWPI